MINQEYFYFKETLEQQATGQTPEEQAEELIKEQDEEQLEDVEFHDVEEEPSELNMDDTHSDVPSDFEVIPLPECFDTTKPLSPTDKAKEEGTFMSKKMLVYLSSVLFPQRVVFLTCL